MTITPTAHKDGCKFFTTSQLDDTCPRCQALIVLGQQAAKKRAGRRVR